LFPMEFLLECLMPSTVKACSRISLAAINLFLICLFCFPRSFSLLVRFFHRIIIFFHNLVGLLSSMTAFGVHKPRFCPLRIWCSMKCLPCNLLWFICLFCPRLISPCERIQEVSVDAEGEGHADGAGMGRPRRRAGGGAAGARTEGGAARRLESTAPTG
jgi:hypothetical protein